MIFHFIKNYLKGCVCMIYRFVLTGGPCGGKSTAISRLFQFFKERGYNVLIVPETATELIQSGISPSTLPIEDFQEILLEMSLEKEKNVMRAAKLMKGDVVILYDRGIMDTKAYISESSFLKILKKQKMTVSDARDRYDAVFHLTSAACGAERFYTLSNNSARKETIEEARALDTKTKEAWIGHSSMYVIDNSTDFEGKIKRLFINILSQMGLQDNVSIQKKYVIKRPTDEFLERCVGLDIFQTYLKSIPFLERRIRQKGNSGDFSYYYCEKKYDENDNIIMKKEKIISEEEYLTLLMEGEKQLRKKRYWFIYKNQYFSIDIHPDWDEEAILEVGQMKPIFPGELTIIKEVSQEQKYRNIQLAK